LSYFLILVESSREGGGDILKLGKELLGKLTLVGNGVKDLRLGGSEVSKELSLESANLGDRNVVKETVNTGKDNGDLLLGTEGRGLLLLKNLGKTLTTGKSLLGGSIKIRTELGESSNLTVLGQEKLEGTSNLLHGLDLSSGTDTGNGKTDVNGGSDTLVEELSLQEDLTISNGNNVGGNVSRDITTLGLNDGESSQGTGAELLRHLGGTLKETRVEVENITGVSLTSRRTSQKKRHLSVGNSLLGQIVVDDKGVSAVISEPLTKSTTGERSNVLKRSSLGSSGSNNDGVLEGIVLLKGLDELSNGGSLLTNGNVDTVELLGLIRTVVPSLLVEDGVNGNGGLTGLTITNNQLTLATANGDEGVDRLKTSLHGLVDRATGKNTGGLDLSTDLLGGLNGSLAIDGVTEGIDDTTKHGRADGNVDNGTSTLDSLTFLDESVGTEQDDTDLASLQVKSHTLDTGRELNELLSLNVVKTENTGDTITNREDTTSLVKISFTRNTTDALLEDRGDLSGRSLGGGKTSGQGGASDSNGSLSGRNTSTAN